MSRYSRWSTVLTFALSFSMGPLLFGQQPAPPDVGLYTTYSMDYAHQNTYWSVCGSPGYGATGCYGFGSLGPFGKIGAMVEGNPVVSGNTVTRMIYLIDIASGALGTGVTLNAYTKSDVVTSTDDTVTVTLSKTVNLPLTGGTTATCWIAATSTLLFVGTNQSQQAVTVKKSTLFASKVQAYFQGLNISAMTVDKYGYVTVTQGSFGSGANGFTLFTSRGVAISAGGGASFMLNTTMGFSTANLPPAKP